MAIKSVRNVSIASWSLALYAEATWSRLNFRSPAPRSERARRAAAHSSMPKACNAAESIEVAIPRALISDLYAT